MVEPIGPKHLAIVGATGMVGGYALRYALDHSAVGRVTAIPYAQFIATLLGKAVGRALRRGR